MSNRLFDRLRAVAESSAQRSADKQLRDDSNAKFPELQLALAGATEFDAVGPQPRLLIECRKTMARAYPHLRLRHIWTTFQLHLGVSRDIAGGVFDAEI